MSAQGSVYLCHRHEQEMKTSGSIAWLYEQNTLLDCRRLANYFWSSPPCTGEINCDGSPALRKVRTQEAENTNDQLSRPVGFDMPTGLYLSDRRHLGDL